MLGIADTIASLRVGQPANFNQFSVGGRLEATYLRGERLR
jgi:N-acetylglucosamine-6-phosphate deacetylase